MIHRQLMDYYTKLLQEHGGIPPRSAISPADIKSILAWVILGEWHGPEAIIPTVIGSAIDDALATSLTGVNLFDYYSADVVEALRLFYTKMYAQPCGAFTVRDVANKYGVIKGLEIQSLPLRDENGVLNRLIGSIMVRKRTVVDYGFGKPEDIGKLRMVEMEYLDIGYGVPS